MTSDARAQRAVSGKRGGLLLRVGTALFFVPASIAVSIDPRPAVVRVPGAPAEVIGIAAHEGEIVAVVSLAAAAPALLRHANGAEAPTAHTDATITRDEGREMIVCRYAAELVGLVGATIVGAGLFEVLDDNAVAFSGETACELDIASLYARLRGGAWAGRWGG